MSDLTYVEPTPPMRPFKKGDKVEVLDRDGSVLSRRTVIRAGKRVAVTECSRRWRQADGWFIGSTAAHPFPSIRLEK